MRRFFPIILVVCVVAALFSPSSQADNNNSSLRVDESLTRLFLGEKTAEVLLVVENQAATQNAKIRLELVAPNGEAKEFASRELILKGGKNEIKLSSNFYAALVQDALIYYRLRYEITAQNQTVRGVMSVSEIAPEVFELEVSATDYLRESMRYRAHVQAVQPISQQGVSDVKIVGELRLDLKTEGEKDEIKLTAESKTNSEGFATLNFEIPANARFETAEIKISGSKNGIVRQADDDLYGIDGAYIYRYCK